MVLNDRINEEVYFLFRQAQVKGLETERLGKIHVSDLIKECDRYVAYGKITPPDFKSMDTESLSTLFMGQCVHKNTVLVDEQHSELFLAWDYVQNKPLTYEEAKSIPEDDPRQLDIIYGSIDDLVYVDGEAVIVDKKTTKKFKWTLSPTAKAHDSHRLQVNCYRVLLQKCYGIDAKSGCNIYIPIGNEEEGKVYKDRPTPIAYKLGKPEETEAWMIERAKSIKRIYTDFELPKRTKCFLCDSMCPYASKCFSDERTHYKETTVNEKHNDLNEIPKETLKSVKKVDKT